MTTQDRLNIIGEIRSNYSTPLGPWGGAICRRVASEFNRREADERAGVRRKTYGRNCDGIACDIVMYPDGTCFDILRDSENTGVPQWSLTAPLSPVDYEYVPPEGEVPQPPPSDREEQVIFQELGNAFSRLAETFNMVATLFFRLARRKGV